MSGRRRRKQSRTRRIEGSEAQQRQAAEASAAFWHGNAGAAQTPADGASASPSAQPAAMRRPRAQSDDVLATTRRVTVTTDPTSTVRSLGKPPLGGRETAAEHYFDAVYQRSVAMAAALAAAGGLLREPDDDFS